MTVRLEVIRPKRFKKIFPQTTPQDAMRGIKEYLEEVKKELQQDYIRVPSSPSYSRTRKLREGWKVHSLTPQNGLLTNDVPYAVFVQGPNRPYLSDRQSRTMRKKGWRSVSEIARSVRPSYAQIMNRSIKGFGPNSEFELGE